MLPAGFEPAIPSSERPQNHPLDRVATGVGTLSAITRDMSDSWKNPKFSLPPFPTPYSTLHRPNHATSRLSPHKIHWSLVRPLRRYVQRPTMCTVIIIQQKRKQDNKHWKCFWINDLFTVHLQGQAVKDLHSLTLKASSPSTGHSDSIGEGFTVLGNIAIYQSTLQKTAMRATDADFSWFQIFAVFWMLYAFFWVIPRRLNFICRRFGTLCSIFIGG
jgi:hypothetical protein